MPSEEENATRPSRSMTESISKSQIAIVMGIVTAVAGGTWAVANGQIEHEREQYAECVAELNETNDFIASLSAVCDDRIAECVTTGDGRVSGVNERLDECITKLLVWNGRASGGLISGSDEE
jgi:hypothetical protein